MVRAVKRSTMRGAGTTGGQSPATTRSKRGRPSVSSRIRSALASSVSSSFSPEALSFNVMSSPASFPLSSPNRSRNTRLVRCADPRSLDL